MRLIILTCLIVAVACASAASTNTKKQVKPKNCKECDPAKEEIICAEGDGHKFSFYNRCVLEKVNCENSRNMKEISQGLCPGQTAASIRIS